MAKNYLVLPETMYTQTDPLKEASKNLVNSEYAYSVDRRVRRQTLRALYVITGFAAAFTWLLALTVYREVQITALRRDVETVSADLIVMKMTLQNLNQKIASYSIIDDNKNSDAPIYADVEQDHAVEESSQDAKEWSYLSDKIKGLTVLEDEDMADDEDSYDNDYSDSESGDWYPDYDRRRDMTGVTSMEKLKPEDFDSEVIQESNGVIPPFKIEEIKRRLNEEHKAAKLSLTDDIASPGLREKRSVFKEFSKGVDDEFMPRAMAVALDERRKTKKYIAAEDKQEISHTSGRTVRDSQNEGRAFIAAHFHGNTSHLNKDIHEHYKGNGLLRVSHDAPHDVWYPSPWTLASQNRPTLTRSGHVHVHHTGIYLVYVQIYYLDSHDVISWVLHRTSADIEGRQPVLQCAQSSHSTERRDRPNSCFSAAALFLKAGDRLAVRNTGGDRHSLMQPEKSFIGLVKLADADDPQMEL